MISAKIVADSVSSETGQRITTFELEYPRFIHSEVLTHRAFSRNAASSRAIPIEKMMEMVNESPAKPEVWGLNQAGMQAEKVHGRLGEINSNWAWTKAARAAVRAAKRLQHEGLHKQIVNRVLEPFSHMKVVVTATDFDNFFWLRCHKDAQPEIRILAEAMKEAYDNNVPQLLHQGEWHLPYYGEGWWSPNYHADVQTTLEVARKISASCCAQVSYRKTDDSVEKALRIYDALVSMAPVHASPFEHQATPIVRKELSKSLEGCVNYGGYPEPWQEGVTHVDRYGQLWSGNFRNFIQFRQLIDGHDFDSYSDSRG